jgi:hypothetical protein
MNPVTIVTKVAVATGRRLSSSYAKSSGSSNSTIGRVVGSVGTVPSSSSSLRQKQTTDTTGTVSSPLNQLIRLVAPGAAAQRRTKSSLAAEIEHESSASSSVNATANATYDQSVREPFPSIVIGPERSIEPQGSFAEAQAQVRRHNDIEKKMMVYTHISISYTIIFIPYRTLLFLLFSFLIPIPTWSRL